MSHSNPPLGHRTATVGTSGSPPNKVTPSRVQKEVRLSKEKSNGI